MNDFEDDRSKLSGLHFAQESMRKHERITLHLAEAMQRRLVLLLELCDESEAQAKQFEEEHFVRTGYRNVNTPLLTVEQVRDAIFYLRRPTDPAFD